MGKRNVPVEGGSCTGKTSVCEELQRRGFQAVHGDRELACAGDPETGRPLEGITGLAVHDHHVWDVGKVTSIVADRDAELTFFCGGSRNVASFLHLFDEVFVLDVDLDTLHRRLDARPEDEWGGAPAERALIVRLHRTREGSPPLGSVIDATAPIEDVVDEIIMRSQASRPASGSAG